MPKWIKWAATDNCHRLSFLEWEDEYIDNCFCLILYFTKYAALLHKPKESLFYHIEQLNYKY